MKKYWVCIIEVEVGRKKLPTGFDSPPRHGAMEAIEKHNIKINDCWSGWGCKPETFDEIMRVWK